MANNRIPYGLCKKYGIKLRKGATPYEAWEALKKNGYTANDDSEEYIEPKQYRQNTSYQDIIKSESEPEYNDVYDSENIEDDFSDYPTVWLSKKEYAMVMSELATNLTDEEHKMPVVTKYIRNYAYRVVVRGFGNYRVIGKYEIKPRKRRK